MMYSWQLVTVGTRRFEKLDPMSYDDFSRSDSHASAFET